MLSTKDLFHGTLSKSIDLLGRGSLSEAHACSRKARSDALRIWRRCNWPFRAVLRRLPQQPDSVAERDEFEPSDDLVSIAGVSVCTGVAFTVGRPRADWEVRDLIRQMSATNPRVQIFRGG